VSVAKSTDYTGNITCSRAGIYLKTSTHLLKPKSCIPSVQFFHGLLKLININLYFTVLCCVVLCCVVLCCVVLCCFILYYIILYYIILYYIILYYIVGRYSSVGIVTCYWLEGPGIECRWGARFSALVQTFPASHPASYTIGTGSFPGGKAAGTWH